MLTKCEPMYTTEEVVYECEASDYHKTILSFLKKHFGMVVEKRPGYDGPFRMPPLEFADGDAFHFDPITKVYYGHMIENPDLQFLWVNNKTSTLMLHSDGCIEKYPDGYLLAMGDRPD